jgi:DNA topoisomerase-3
MENAGRQIEDDELSAVLRDKGLGTPATRSEIIENLILRGYVKRVGKPLAATPKGIRLIDILRRIHVDRLASAELTGELEFHLRQIERGDRTRDEFSNEIKEYTQEIVERAKGFVFDKLYTKDPALGRCPSCRKRQVVEESLVYRCKGVAKKTCSFLLWKEKHGRYLDRTTVETLLKEGKTPPVAGFFTREEKPYRAVLTLDGSGQVQIEPEHALDDEEAQAPVDPTPIGPCPVCKAGQIIETPLSYICSTGEKDGCPFALPRKLLARTMTRQEVATYITDGKTPVLEGFISRRGRPFRASLILGENGRHTWEFPSREATSARGQVEIGEIVDTESLGACPLCKKGAVVTAEGAYACSEGKEGCPFNLPRTVLGREISRPEAVAFVKEGQTDVLEGFISRRGRPFRAALVLGKNGKFRWKFPSRTQA